MPGDAEIERFWKHVELQKDGCWLWAGGRFSAGSGELRRPGRIEPRRFIWEQICPRIPKGMRLENMCANSECINPEHLELRKIADG